MPIILAVLMVIGSLAYVGTESILVLNSNGNIHKKWIDIKSGGEEIIIHCEKYTVIKSSGLPNYFACDKIGKIERIKLNKDKNDRTNPRSWFHECLINNARRSTEKCCRPTARRASNFKEYFICGI